MQQPVNEDSLSYQVEFVTLIYHQIVVTILQGK